MPEPLDRSASWPNEHGDPSRYSYARIGSPTVDAAEAALGALDGGRALLFPSGMSAVTTALLTLLRPGATVALAEGAYYGHRRLLDHLQPWQLQTLEFDQTGPPPQSDLVLVEAPANPLLTMPDLGAAVAQAAPVVCDATLATPLFVRPLERGCALALHSATKFLGGHDDLLAGVLVTGDDDLYERLRETRHLTGAIAGPDTAWLLLRGLETLEARVMRQTETARSLAERLGGHPAVTTVRYPGFGGVVSFDVVDSDSARRVETRTHVIKNATSLGGTRSKLESRRRWEGERCPPGLIRFSVGLEDADQLWEDLAQALAHASA
jgi:cystathionine gamma-synthase